MYTLIVAGKHPEDNVKGLWHSSVVMSSYRQTASLHGNIFYQVTCVCMHVDLMQTYGIPIYI